MMIRTFPLVALALALITSSSALAAKAIGDNTHDGKVVSATADKLVMTGQDGKEYSHALTTDAKLTLDGKDCQIGDLKGGMRIRVTLNAEATPQVSKIEALDKNPEFEIRN
jgi:hypothetical protein